MALKASEALALVAGLVTAHGYDSVDAELRKLEELQAPPPPSQTAIDVTSAIVQLGDVSEVRAILDALPKTDGKVATEHRAPRRSKAEVEELQAKVLERVNALGSEVTAAEVASQLGVDARGVSYALQGLYSEGKITKTGNKRTTRYAAVKAA